ncbi:apoptosis-stimulating of p53 protein 2-like [Thalassophryne amazonica]|uniref:apoptosis-stimulating of p53 protein 2-like n=1 Tax=Thalassophryne amazonica TaxID=390379 RepID=UPI0014719D1B|nr:apoptosis-stimulating of p53 protein 2-like [Thalassophryne amazonica]
MMPTFLTVFLSEDKQHVSEVPVTPDTLCRDVVELCKEPGEDECYLSESWRGSERIVNEGERMLEVLQQWGKKRGEVQYLLHHQRPPRRDSGGSRTADHMIKSNQMKDSTFCYVANSVSSAPAEMMLSELQDLATRQQQQINAQKKLLASKEQQMMNLQLEDQWHHQQELSDQDRLQRLRENAQKQEAKLHRVRALRGQVEHKRHSNSKLVEEVDQMTGMFQQKQRELLLAVARVEELSGQLEALRSSRLLENPLSHHCTSSSVELELLYKELQLRNKLNQGQSDRLQQQRESLNKRNLEVAVLDRRLLELRQRLWKKKAALQRHENPPVAPDSTTPQHGGGSRVAAVGPYIQSTSKSKNQAPPLPPRPAVVTKPVYLDGITTLPRPDTTVKPPPRPLKPAAGITQSHVTKLSDWKKSFAESSGGCSHASTLPQMSRTISHGEGGETPKDKKRLSGSSIPPPVPVRTNHITENMHRDKQSSSKGQGMMSTPPPLPSEPNPSLIKPAYSTGTFPGKVRTGGGNLKALSDLSTYSNTLPLPNKPDNPPAAAVRPYALDPAEAPPSVLQKPQTLTASSIYSMYTQQATLGKSYQANGQGTLTRGPPRVYGKPALPTSGGQQADGSDVTSVNCCSSVTDRNEVDTSCQTKGDGVGAEATECNPPRPLSPTKLLPFLSNHHRNPNDGDLDAFRRRLHHAPRPLKKRNSITEPEGPAGPNIQKLLYQKATLAAMETIPMETVTMTETHTEPARTKDVMSSAGENIQKKAEPTDNSQAPPPLLPHSPIADPASWSVSSPPVEHEEETNPTTSASPDQSTEEYPPYPPPLYPCYEEPEPGNRRISLQPPEVTGQVAVQPVKRSILHRAGSRRLDRGLRVKFSPLALLLDSSLEGEYDLVQRVIYEVDDPSAANDEGITALHNCVCAGHMDIVKFLVQFGVNINAADSDGWTPLHCAASCNNVQVCKFLVESGAAVFATTCTDMQTAADKCEELEDGYAQCSQFLYGVQEKMGVMNRGVVYALWDYEAQREDELDFSEGDCITVLRRDDKLETEWWWVRCGDHEGYIPRNLLGLYLRIRARQRSLA